MYFSHTFREVIKEGVVIYQIEKTKYLTAQVWPRVLPSFTFRLIGVSRGYRFLLLLLEAAETGFALQREAWGFPASLPRTGWKGWSNSVKRLSHAIVVSGCICQFSLIRIKLVCWSPSVSCVYLSSGSEATLERDTIITPQTPTTTNV